MKIDYIQRIVATLVLLFGLYVTPWWLWFLLVLIAVWAFPYYVESILLSLLADMLYGELTFSSTILNAPSLWYTVGGIGVYVIGTVVIKRLVPLSGYDS